MRHRHCLGSVLRVARPGRTAAALTGAALSFTSIAATAQVVASATPAASGSPATLNEVVVVARRRAESLQEVPAAVTAFGAAQIESAGITRPADFIAQTPNVTFIETQNAGTSFIQVRGISQARNSEPSVAVIVDGVQQVSPSQFNQELFDVQQIEVLKGPQGGLYGRNAIGGAIVITTKPPTDTLTGRIKVGADNGPGFKVQGGLSGPVAGLETLKFRAGVSYTDTDGYIPNVYTGKNADPLKELATHFDLLWQATPNFSADLRLAADQLLTTGFYYNIVNGANDTSVPVEVNNRGKDDRDTYDVSLKLDYKLDQGTLSSITAYDTVREIVTGDGTDFKPITQSLLYKLYGFDLTQSQFLDVSAVSEELRFASPAEKRLRYIVGTYLVGTQRYISTSNLKDLGLGANPIYKVPGTNPSNPTYSFLADGQRNFAWALFGDLAFDVTSRLEIDGSLRYDDDHRRQTTLTPLQYLPNVPGFPQGATGDVRAKTFVQLQPKLTVRYKVTDPIRLYASYSKGFRSGGFNQTGVAAVSAAAGFVGVRDYYDAEVAETYEVGAKARLFERRLDLEAAVYTTKSANGYFFFYLATNGTQNLGNIPRTRYNGFELSAVGHPLPGLDVNAGFGYTDSEIQKFPDPTVIGNQAPLVSRYTANLGLQYRRELGNGLDGLARLDYQRIGRTWFDVSNSTSRNPIDLVDMRVGVDHGSSWSAVLYAKNLTNTLYNAEWAPGNFAFKAKPRRYGIELTKTF